MNKILNLLNKDKEVQEELKNLTNSIKPYADNIALKMCIEYRRLRSIYNPKYINDTGDWCYDYNGITLTIKDNNLLLNYLTPIFAEKSEPNFTIKIDDSIFEKEGMNNIVKNLSESWEKRSIESKKKREQERESEIIYLKNRLEKVLNDNL